jgi:hypothetical protein
MTTLPFRSATGKPGGPEQDRKQLRFRPITDAPQRTARSYLLPGRIASGCFSLIVGHGGTLKSHLLASLAASALGGLRLPGAPPKRFVGNVLIVSREQDQYGDLRPQIEAAGGDPSKVLGPDDDEDDLGEAWNWWRFLEVLPDLIWEKQLALVGLDPLLALLPDGMNTGDPRQVRAALQPLHRIAMRTNAYIVGVGHLVKRPSQNVHWNGLGGVEFFNVARCVLTTAKISGRENEYALRAIKHQFGREAPDLVYRHDGEGGRDRIVFVGEEELAADALEAGESDPGEQLANDLAAGILHAFWSDEPVDYKLIRDAAKRDGVSDSTLRRRMKKLGIKTERKSGWGRKRCLVHFPQRGKKK